uniref:SAM domain-containing protein n=1 Tax=Haptolina ericina TaxID=156174 RepID=A0A7S3ABB2_9EUKA
MSNDLRDKGIAIANEAVSADHAGQYQDALNKYTKAAEYLQTALKYEKNPITLKTLKEKILEYVTRAEVLKKGLEEQKNPPKKGAKGAAGGAAKDEEEEEEDDEEEEAPPLTEEQLKKAEEEMEEDLAKLVGMESVKVNMRKLCKQLSLDIKRRQEKMSTLDSIRHMMFTGNPGVGKTTVSRLVARLYKQLGVSSKETVVEVQKGDLVAGYVNQTSIKTAKKIKEARGGILFVDEAYQLTQALQRGQSDFSGEAIDEMMKVMNDSGRKATTFVFAGYKKEMDEFVQYNAGLESRIKYRFHFDDYSVKELVTIVNIKLKSKGYKMTPDASNNLHAIIEKGTNQELRSKYNGRLTDNLLQWASDEMNTRLSSNAKGEELITLDRADFEAAIKRFNTTKPPTKADPALLGGKQVERQLHDWKLDEYAPLFIRAGYRQPMDMVSLQGEKDIRALGVTKDADVRRCALLVQRLQQEHRQMSFEMDALFIDPDTADIKTWLEKRALQEFSKVFEKHRIDFEVLGDLTYEDIKEMGIHEVGPRRKIHRAIVQWRDERDAKKAETMMDRMNRAQPAQQEQVDLQPIAKRLLDLRQSVSGP